VRRTSFRSSPTSRSTTNAIGWWLLRRQTLRTSLIPKRALGIASSAEIASSTSTSISFEYPFKRYWIDGDVLSRLAGKEVVILNDVDYAAFKLFHLSVLWRASVSSHGAFQQVRLGPHEEKIRQLLINRSPGEPWEYPIVCAAMTEETGDVQHNFVVPAMHFRYPGCRGYHFAFCGCQWLYYVASHHVRDLDHISLSADGRLPVLARPIEVVMKSIIAAVKRDARK
jgi:hypothetical protein